MVLGPSEELRREAARRRWRGPRLPRTSLRSCPCPLMSSPWEHRVAIATPAAAAGEGRRAPQSAVVRPGPRLAQPDYSPPVGSGVDLLIQAIRDGRRLEPLDGQVQPERQLPH